MRGVSAWQGRVTGRRLLAVTREGAVGSDPEVPCVMLLQRLGRHTRGPEE